MTETNLVQLNAPQVASLTAIWPAEVLRFQRDNKIGHGSLADDFFLSIDLVK